jgi:signal transduction histidine kinase
MTQEGLNNAVQHAQARHLTVIMKFNINAATLEISDDGKGFILPRTPAEFTPQGHFGLLGLYERAELIGAHLEITSSPATGTRLNIELSYPHQD